MKTIKSINSCILKPLKVNNKPIHLQIEITSRCNQNCQMCMRRKGLKNLGLGDMNIKNFINILDQIKPKKISLIGFGEPLYHPQVCNFIKEAKKRNISVQMVSNFALLNKNKIIKLIESGLDTIKISIESSNKKLYKKIRGVDSFNKVIQNIKDFIQIKKELKSKKPYLRFTSVLQKDNIFDIENIINLAYNLKVPIIYFKPVTIACLNKNKKYLFSTLEYETIINILEKSLIMSKKLKIKTNLKDLIKEIKNNWFGYKSGEYNQKGICLIPWFSCYICYDGTVRLCGDCYNENTNIGNIFKEGFNKIWNNPKYQLYRYEIKKGNNPLNVCKTCTNIITFKCLIKRSKFLPGFI